MEAGVARLRRSGLLRVDVVESMEGHDDQGDSVERS